MDHANGNDEQGLLGWYENALTRRVDLIGDYAGNELFLIEGDSLLLNCISTSKVDFESGFQILHAVHAVENFLQGLLLRKCNFHVVFFRDHEALCVPDNARSSTEAKCLLTREILIRHLRLNLPPNQSTLQIRVFSSMHSKDFTSYLTNTGVYFFMCHDGAAAGASTTYGSASNNETRSKPPARLRNKIAFRYMIYEFIRQGYNVALVNGLEWKDSKVITTVIEGVGRSLLPLTLDFALGKSEEENLKKSTALEKLERLQSLQGLDERDILTVLTLSELLHQDGAGGRPLQVSAFILHAAVLHLYRLSARRVGRGPRKSANEEFLLQFSQRARRILQMESYGQILESLRLSCNLGDLLDGSIFHAAAHVLDQGLNFGPADRSLFSEYQRLAAVTEALSNIHLPAIIPENLPSSVTPMHEFPGQATRTSSTLVPSSVMPFRNPIFDHHLAPVKLRTDDALPGTIYPAKTFKEISHWHNLKRPLGPRAPSKPMGFFAHRRHQRHMAEMIAYAASLTNAVGKSLEPEVIIPLATNTRAKDQRKPDGKDQKASIRGKQAQSDPRNKQDRPKTGKAAGKAAALAAGADLQARKAETKGRQSLAFWVSRCKELDAEPDCLLRYSKAGKIRSDLGKLEAAMVGAEVELYMVSALTLKWREYCEDKRRDLRLGVAALIWNHLVGLAAMTGLTREIVSKVELTVKVLGLPKITIPTPPSERELSFAFALDRFTKDDLSVSMNPTEFQLLHCGPYFDRSIDSAPDERVPFEPDGWQREVLDAIDARKSLFVVAPTSSGKTFISFYAMKQILQSNNDVLVYVAPTKALVSQIAAEIQARFHKSFSQAGRSVWAIHTRDHRINSPTGCQILVTVPHILQIMLLAPSNAEKNDSWSCRVKRIIFDEVHCIGQAEDGIVWEQLLLLAPCPIIALSATVGNPEEFNRWLKCTQASIGSDLVMVTHPHRYSDLRKFMYLPPKKFLFQGTGHQMQLSMPGLDANCHATKSFAFIHPVASLINTSRGMPDDFSLEARDCLTLWRSMSERQTNKFKLDESLHPSKALPEIIRKSDIILWEAELKKVLKRWMAEENSPFEDVRTSLQATVNSAEREEIYKTGQSYVGGSQEAQSIDQKDLCSTTLPMLTDLHSRDALPAILFNFDRGMCEKICESVLEQLKAAEASWKSSSPTWAKKMADFKRWKKEQHCRAPKRSAGVGPKKHRSKDDEDKLSRAAVEQETASADPSSWASFNPDAPAKGFHFADNKKLSDSEFEEYEKGLLWQSQPAWLIEALKRGIGVHHSGMNRTYRQTVEMLFRKGFLRVVIATGTLALGINMPCKTVVFSGDSVFLTALNFRQAAGRAGRRGFDLLGNVIFQGIPVGKVYRLLSSRLPDLNGHFPLSTTLVLRLFTLLHESKNSQYAVKAINSLLSQPRLCLGGAESKTTVLHHLRFSIEYLRRQFLLGTDGAPLNFAGCVSHLYFTENSSFAFHALLKDGYFHELCADINRSPKLILRTIMLVMAHLFGRYPCRLAEKEWFERLISRSSSVVFLPALPPKAEAVLRKHNDDTLDIFKTYVKTYIDQHIQEQDCRLPLSGVKCGGDGIVSTDCLMTPLPATCLRSPFAALSGYDDNFESIADLCRNVRSGVFLEESVIPHLAISPFETDGPLNAYLYDFFQHGDITALQKANGIKRGDVWFVLNDFSLVLATIITSLTNFIKPGQNADMDMINIQGSGDSYQTQQADLAPEDGGESDNSGEDDESGAPAWDREGGQGLVNVLKAFHMLKNEFDSKFKAMWA